MNEERLGRFNKWGYKNSFSKGELANELVYMNRDYDKLQSKLQDKEKIIEDAKDKLYCWGEVLDAEFQHELLSILERK